MTAGVLSAEEYVECVQVEEWVEVKLHAGLHVQGHVLESLVSAAP